MKDFIGNIKDLCHVRRSKDQNRAQTCVSLLDSLKQPNPDGLASPFTAECLDQEKHIEDTNYLILHIFALFGNTIVRILNYLDLQNKQRREQRFFVNG